MQSRQSPQRPRLQLQGAYNLAGDGLRRTWLLLLPEEYFRLVWGFCYWLGTQVFPVPSALPLLPQILGHYCQLSLGLQIWYLGQLLSAHCKDATQGLPWWSSG